MIFLVQSGIKKHLYIFSKTANCTNPLGSCNFFSLWKNLLALLNHVITYTNAKGIGNTKHSRFKLNENYTPTTRKGMKYEI